MKKGTAFPRIDANFKVSNEVLNEPIGPLPQDVDFDAETKKMWEEMAEC